MSKGKGKEERKKKAMKHPEEPMKTTETNMKHHQDAKKNK